MSEFTGIYRGSVHDVNDPDSRGRLRALVPAVLGDASSAWAEPMLPTADTVVWSVGDRVWLMFEDGDINHPVYLSRPEVRTEDLDPVVAEVLSSVTEVLERASTTFSTATDPFLDPERGVRAGDLWLQPITAPGADGVDTVVHVLRRRNDENTGWELIADAGALEAIRAAQAAANLADGKMRIFHEPAATGTPLRPLSDPLMRDPEDRGDLWFNESDNNKPRTWSGPTIGWESAQDVSIVPGSRLAADAIDGKTITGSVVQTAATPSERLVMRNDGSGGVLESFSGVPGELPGVLDPAGFTDSSGKYRPSMRVQAGRVPSDNDVRAPYVLLQSASSGGGTAVVDAKNIRIGTENTDQVRVLGHLRVEGKLALLGSNSRPIGTIDFGASNVTTNGQGEATFVHDLQLGSSVYFVIFQSRLNGQARTFNILGKNANNVQLRVDDAASGAPAANVNVTFDYVILGN